MNAAQRRRGRRYGGLLTYVKSHLHAACKPLSNSRILALDVGGLTIANVYLPYNGHPDETQYHKCITDLEKLRDSSESLVVTGDFNPTGDNAPVFNSFVAANSLSFDKSVEWTFIEPRAFNQSRLDFCLVEESPLLELSNSYTVHDTVIKGGHLPLVSLNVPTPQLCF